MRVCRSVPLFQDPGSTNLMTTRFPFMLLSRRARCEKEFHDVHVHHSSKPPTPRSSDPTTTQRQHLLGPKPYKSNQLLSSKQIRGDKRRMAAKLNPLKDLKVLKHQIPAHGLTPNTSIQNKPLLIYKSAFPSHTSASDIKNHLKSVGVVSPQWEFSMYTVSHFHVSARGGEFISTIQRP